MTETWNVFTGSDIFLGLLGAVGFLSMIVVIVTASGRVDKREKVLRAAVDAKNTTEKIES